MSGPHAPNVPCLASGQRKIAPKGQIWVETGSFSTRECTRMILSILSMKSDEIKGLLIEILWERELPKQFCKWFLKSCKIETETFGFYEEWNHDIQTSSSPLLPHKNPWFLRAIDRFGSRNETLKSILQIVDLIVRKWERSANPTQEKIAILKSDFSRFSAWILTKT